MNIETGHDLKLAESTLPIIYSFPISGSPQSITNLRIALVKIMVDSMHGQKKAPNDFELHLPPINSPQNNILVHSKRIIDTNLLPAHAATEALDQAELFLAQFGVSIVQTPDGTVLTKIDSVQPSPWGYRVTTTYHAISLNNSRC